MESDRSRADERGWLLVPPRPPAAIERSRPGGRPISKRPSASRATIGDPLLAAYALADRGLILCILTETERGIAALAAGVDALEALPDGSCPPRSRGRGLDRGRTARAAAHATGERHVPPRRHRWPRGGARWPYGWGTPGASPRREPWERPTWPRRRGRTAPTRWCCRGSATRSSRSRLAEAALGRPDGGAGGVAAGASGVSRDRPPLPGRTCPRPRVDGGRLALLHDRSRGAARHSSRTATAALARAGGAFGATSDRHLLELDVLVLEGAWAEAERLARSALGIRPPLFLQQAVFGLAVSPAGGVSRQRRGITSRPACPRDPPPRPAATSSGTRPPSNAWPSTSRWTPGTFRPPLPGWRRTIAGWPGVAPCAAGRRGQLLWARYHRVAGDLDPRRADGDRRRRRSDRSSPAAGVARRPSVPRRVDDRDSRASRRRSRISGDSLELADACAAPFERALTLMALAELRAAEGKTWEAARLLAEVRAIAEPLGAAPLLTRADALIVAACRAASPGRHKLTAVGARDRGVATRRGRAVESRDRRRALHQPAHRHHPPDAHLRQTRGREPGRGGRTGAAHGTDLIRIDREIRMAIVRTVRDTSPHTWALPQIRPLRCVNRTMSMDRPLRHAVVVPIKWIGTEDTANGDGDDQPGGY